MRAAAADMTPKQLKEHLTFPQTWGPTEWGPISFLPEHDILASQNAANPFDIAIVFSHTIVCLNDNRKRGHVPLEHLAGCMTQFFFWRSLSQCE